MDGCISTLEDFPTSTAIIWNLLQNPAIELLVQQRAITDLMITVSAFII